MESGTRGIDHHGVGRRQARQHVLGPRGDEASGRQATAAPVHGFLIGIDTDHARARFDEERGGVADAAVEVPDCLAPHIAELIDRPAAGDRAHAGVHLLERRRRKSRHRPRDDSGRTVHRLPPTDDVGFAQRPAQLLGIEPGFS